MEQKGFATRDSPAPPYATAEMNAIQNENYSHPQPPPPYNSGFMPLPQQPPHPRHPPQAQNTSYVVQRKLIYSISSTFCSYLYS